MAFAAFARLPAPMLHYIKAFPLEVPASFGYPFRWKSKIRQIGQLAESSQIFPSLTSHRAISSQPHCLQNKSLVYL